MKNYKNYIVPILIVFIISILFFSNRDVFHKEKYYGVYPVFLSKENVRKSLKPFSNIFYRVSLETIFSGTSRQSGAKDLGIIVSCKEIKENIEASIYSVRKNSTIIGLGLQEKDNILSINGFPTQEISCAGINQVFFYFNHIELDVARDGFKDPIHIKITREGFSDKIISKQDLKKDFQYKLVLLPQAIFFSSFFWVLIELIILICIYFSYKIIKNLSSKIIIILCLINILFSYFCIKVLHSIPIFNQFLYMGNKQRYIDTLNNFNLSIIDIGLFFIIIINIVFILVNLTKKGIKRDFKGDSFLDLIKRKYFFKAFSLIRLYVFSSSIFLFLSLIIANKYNLIELHNSRFIEFIMQILFLIPIICFVWYMVNFFSNESIADKWQKVVLVTLPFVFLLAFFADDYCSGWMLCVSEQGIFIFLSLISYLFFTINSIVKFRFHKWNSFLRFLISLFFFIFFIVIAILLLNI